MTYQLGGMLHEIDYANGVTWRQTAETATGWERPDRIETVLGSTPLWSTGDYSYDGAGNISAIGTRQYVYDAFSRFSFVRNNNLTPNEQVATYDAYGNLTTLARSGSTRVLTTTESTNRLAIAGTSYTSNGELALATIDGVAFGYGYDGLGQQLFQQSDTKTWLHVYDANDERLLTWECALNLCGEETTFERYTLRGLGGEVLRTFEGKYRGSLEWKEDYVHRDGQPLAWIKAPAEGAGEIYQYLHADHLGSTRLVTSATGVQVSRHDFLPFGEESTTVTAGDVDLKFTGHERDQPGKPHDYLHARFYSPNFGRFLRIDPAQASAKPIAPQTWNRYSYAANNPIYNVDPDGRECRAGIMLEQDIQDLAKGRITIDTYHERLRARAQGAEIALTIIPAVRAAKAAWSGARAIFAAMALRRGAQMIQGLYGSVSKAALQGALEGGGSTTKIVTSLSRTPEGARALSTAAGENAVELARAASSSGQLFEANFPKKALELMIEAGLAVPKITRMTNPAGQLVTAQEIRFQANVTEYIVGYFKAVP